MTEASRPAPPPSTREELVNVVRRHLDEGVALAPRGSGSKQHLGPALADGARPLSLERLNRIRAHVPGDLVVTVEPGLRLADLQAKLAEHGQWLPLDPPFANATVGGILATASSGPRRLGYGTAKDHLIGMHVVGPTGVVTRSGGTVVKNVTGYDLHKLHTGAFGSLGVIAEANFKVAPRPRCRQALVLGFPTLSAAHAALLDVWHSRLAPVALEAWDGAAADALRARWPDLPAAGALAVIGCEGSEIVVRRHLRDLAGTAAAAMFAHTITDADIEGFWQAVAAAPADRRAQVVVRVGARPTALAGLLETLRPRAGAAVSVGTGVARLLLDAEVDLSVLAGSIAAWQGLARERSEGAYVVVESAPLGRPGRDALPFSTAVVGAHAPGLAHALKQAWDPDQIFNPGRMPA